MGLTSSVTVAMAAGECIDEADGTRTSGGMHTRCVGRRIRKRWSAYMYIYTYLYLALYAAVLTLSSEDGAAWHGAEASSTQTASTWSELNQGEDEHELV